MVLTALKLTNIVKLFESIKDPSIAIQFSISPLSLLNLKKIIAEEPTNTMWLFTSIQDLTKVFSAIKLNWLEFELFLWINRQFITFAQTPNIKRAKFSPLFKHPDLIIL
jgi:hypothetical protein